MFPLSRLSSLLRNLFRKPGVERDLDDELRAYIDLAADEKRRAGLAPGEARRLALAEFQGLEQVKERVRDARAGAVPEQLRQDLSYALRMFVKNRGFTAAAVATLALGIGSSTAIFTIVDTVVYRPLPYADPGRLVKICGNAERQMTDDVSYADFSDIRDGNVFDSMAADDGTAYTVTIEGTRQPVLGAMVTTSWLATLGVRPALGRGFLPEEAQPGRNRVTILTAEYWHRGFGADPHIVGRTLSVEGAAHTIVGVLPPNVLRYEADFLLPLTPAEYPVQRGHRDLDVFARLRPGVTLAQAQAQLDAIARRLQAEYPATNKDTRFSMVPLEKYYANIGARSRQGLLLLLGAVGLVLLITCVNVAGLMLARALVRGRECLIRAALGASRGRLIRQLLAENLLLFVAGGALGLLMARWSIDSLHRLAVVSGYVPQRLGVAIDARAFAFTAAVSLLTGVVFSLAPALRASRVDLTQGLRDSSHTFHGGRRQHRGRRALIVAELALSLVLLASFGLLTRSFLHVRAVAGTLASDRIIETSTEAGRDLRPAVALLQTVLAHVEAMPGIERAAVTSRPPIHGARSTPFRIDGRADTSGRQPMAGDILVSSGYFQTLGIPIVQGRAFADTDTGASPPVVIVSASFARTFFPGATAIGRRIEVIEEDPLRCCSTLGPIKGVTREIVGVAEDIRQANLDEAPALTIYRPYTQIVEHDMYLLARARTAADAGRIAPVLRADLLAAGVGKDWFDVRLLRQVIADSESIRLRRFVLILLGSFAGVALLLAAVGLYGVMAYSVAERRREIGIRVALGATRHQVLRDILGEALRLAFAGLVAGALAAQLITRAIASMLFGVSRTDAATYLAVWVLLAAVAVLAGYVPARRAARVDPMIALRDS